MPYQALAKGESRQGPVALISRATTDARLRAIESCGGVKENVIVAEEIIKLEELRGLLGGQRDDKRDHPDLPVDEAGQDLVEAIGQRMAELGLPLVLKTAWPNGAKAGCVLTHDIDFLSFSPFHKIIWRRSEHPLRFPGLLYGGALKRKNYGWNIPETVELERQHGFRSTFLFMTTYGKDEARYLQPSLNAVRDAGSEIALHASESSHKDAEAMSVEMDAFREKVGSYPKGLRHHILKFQPPHTWEIECQFGLEYDATFGYNRFFGFRAGTCFPFHPFTSTARLPILELPTGFMDWTALHRSNDPSKFGEFLQLAKERVEAFGGLLVVNFHNTYLNEETFPSVIGEYRSLLGDIRDKGYWVTTAAECARWWARRSMEKIEPYMNDDGTVTVDNTEVSVRAFYQKDEARLRYKRTIEARPRADSVA